MSNVIENCPTMNQCCAVVPLRTSLVLIAALGLACGGAFVVCFTAYGSEALQALGLPRGCARPLRYVHGLLGVQVSALHVLLLVAASAESDALCEVYVWCWAVLWLVLAASSAAVVVCSLVAGSVSFAFLSLLALLLVVIVSLYCTIVVANFRMTLP